LGTFENFKRTVRESLATDCGNPDSTNPIIIENTNEDDEVMLFTMCGCNAK